MSLTIKNKINHYLGTTLAIILLLGIDILTKRFIFHDSSARGRARITPMLNPGAAWSLHIGVPFLILISIGVCIGLIYLYYRSLIERRAFVFIVAGALGNVYDRIVFSGVRDRIHISIFPVFNVADVLITMGVLLIALQYKRQARVTKGT